MGSLGRCAAHLLQGRPEGHEARFGNSEVRHPMALCFYLCAFAPIFHILVAYRPPKSEKSGQTRPVLSPERKFPRAVQLLCSWHNFVAIKSCFAGLAATTLAEHRGQRPQSTRKMADVVIPM